MALATLETWDIVILVLYFVIVLAVGLWATWRAKRGSAQGFFLAGKSMTFLPIAGSIWATNMGASMFVGLAGSAASQGFAPVMFEWHATYMLILLGWIFVPIYIASGTSTMPEYLTKRYGGKRLRIYYAMVCLLLLILTGISGEIYAGALFFRQLLGWDIYLSTIVILLITAVYTIGGGLAAVIYTDFLQTGILIVGATSVSIISMQKIGGYNSMVNNFPYAASNTSYLTQSLYGNLSCGFPPSDYDRIFRGLDSAYPWPGLTFGLNFLALYFFCTNQVMVQRNLSAKNMSHSKAACVIASYLKILPFFLFVWPGMVSRILYPDEIGCSDPKFCQELCDNPRGCTNIAYPYLVLNILPTGLKGLMLAALLAALMSSMTSNFNSGSSLFTMDIWHHIRPLAKEREIVIVGRVFGMILVLLSICWLPAMSFIQGSMFWDYLQSVSSYITPAWTVVFLLGIFWPRTTEQGAWWGLMAGLVTGMARMVIHFAYPTPSCGDPGPDPRPLVFTQVHYTHFAILLAGITFIVAVAVSLVTQPRRPAQLRRVTWWTRKADQEPELTDDEDIEDDEKIIVDKLPENVSIWRRAYNCMCGFSDIQATLTKEEKTSQRRKLTDISENPLWARVCNVNAVIAIALTSFIIGFYG